MRASMVALIGAGLALGACSDTSGPTGDRLSRAEALQLAAQVLASTEMAASGSLETGGAQAPATAGPPVNFTQEHESTHPCASGGEVAVQFVLSGSYDEDTNSLQADLDGSHVHNDCAFPQSGLTMVVSGEPSIGFSVSVGATNGVPSQPFTFALDGGFRWELSDGRAGTCLLDLSAVTDFAEQQRTIQGAVCGHTISDTFSWS